MQPQESQNNSTSDNQNDNTPLPLVAITGEKILQPDMPDSQLQPTAITPVAHQPSSDQTPDGALPSATMTQVSEATSPSPSTYENIILQDTGYLQNLLQKGVTAQTLTLTLYPTHLKIEDASTGDVVEDALINQIKKTSRYFSSRLAYTLYGLFMPTLLLIKTDQKRYKISWVNRDKQAILLGSEAASELSSQQNYTKNMQWVKAIQDLKNLMPNES